MVLRVSAEKLLETSIRSIGQVAQLVEHGPEKAGVGGSRPPLTTLPTFLLITLTSACDTNIGSGQGIEITVRELNKIGKSL